MAERRRGRLKIFMGYAAGVGKTYQMLEEARQLKSQGLDVVIGYFEPHGRKDTIAKTEGMEVIPRKTLDYRGGMFAEMDTAAILARMPQVCLVDEYPHTNVPGSERAKRWEDVELLLDAGIDVLTTMNIQHLESLNDEVWHITGIRVRETIPDWVVHQADEVVMVDLTPRALLHRLQRGVVYTPEKAERALKNFFRESTLVALRELALRETAHEVEHRSFSAVTTVGGDEPGPGLADKNHKILILVTADPATAMLIRRGKRVSDFLNADCFAVTVQRTGRAARQQTKDKLAGLWRAARVRCARFTGKPLGDLAGLPDADREAIEQHLNFARNLHIETRILEGDDVVTALVDFARRNQITQLFLARPAARSWTRLFGRDVVERIVGVATDMQIVIVSGREPELP